ncbi:Hypothetical predicted protein, partial [Paramuricea clavata]
MGTDIRHINCENCQAEILIVYSFCNNCGNRVDTEKEIIQHYFHRGFPYDVILDFLSKHGISISLRTLKRRLQKYGLRKRNSDVDEETVRNLVRSEMANAGEQSGYRTIWHALRLIHNIHPPRTLVAEILHELDPEASNARRSRKLKRRKYLSPGPNYCWHVD